MKKITKIMVFLLSFVVTATAVPLQTFAASKKITAINLEIENNLEVGGEYSTDDIEITTKKANYYVGEVEILNEGGRWKSTDTPKITVTLNAEDGYYFSVVKDNVKIKGGTYVSGKKVDSYTLVLTITLESMQERVGEVKDVWWTSQTGAGWFEAENAGYYEVRLYRNDKAVGELQKVTDTKIDFGNLMRKEGTYGFRVRAVNMKNESTKSEWQQAEETSYIDNETAERLHGICVLNLAKVKYAKDWCQIRGRRIATVFQDPMTSLNPIITIGKQISSIILMHQNCTEAEARRRALELMRKVGIPKAEARFDDYPFQ